MGCDIHCYVEARNGADWEIVPAPADDVESPCRYTIEGPRRSTRNGPWRVYHYEPDRRYLAKWINIRDYELFGWMAGVRREVPNANVARGIPAQVSAEYAEDVDHYAGDGHSHSWLSVSELESREDCPSDLRDLAKEIRTYTGNREARIVFYFDN